MYLNKINGNRSLYYCPPLQLHPASYIALANPKPNSNPKTNPNPNHDLNPNAKLS